MDILIENQQKIIPLNTAILRKIVQKILRHEKITRAALSFVFVTDANIRSLHKKYLGLNSATDVLTFDLSEQRPAGNRVKSLEGDVVISVATACKNAKSFKTSPHYEIVLYIAHGILHLLGYDDHSPKDIKKIRAKEQELMALVKSLIPTK